MKLTDLQKRSIAYQAAFLRERIQHLGSRERTHQTPAQNPKQRLAQWQKNAGGRGGEKSFLTRLQMDGITMEQALSLASEGTGIWQGDLPEYFAMLDEILAMLPFPLIGQEEGSPQDQSAQITSFAPFLMYANNQLRMRMGEKKELFTVEAFAGLVKMLSDVLTASTSELWYERFRLFVLRKETLGAFLTMKQDQMKRYQKEFAEELLAGGWVELLLEFPLLGRIITTYLSYWIQNMAALAEHIAEDQKQLEHIYFNGNPPGQVKSVTGNMGDAHNKGRSVLILEFCQGLKLVYKPRSLEVDEMFIRLLQAFGEMGFPDQLRLPVTWSKEDHGWAEFVLHDSVANPEEANVYYRRMGSLFALVYVLGGNDFHTENLITSGADPILVDLETILSYQVVPFHDEVREMMENFKSNALLGESVLGLGILPVWYPVNKDVWIDLGALTGTQNQSVPHLQGKPLPVREYQAELLQGFQETYEFFLESRGLISKEWLSTILQPLDAPIRFVMRATRVYAQMLHRVTSARYLKDGFLYSTEIERFAAPYFLGVSEARSKELWPLFLSEREAMEERDIPMFFGKVNDRGCYDPEGKLVEDYFETSALDRVLLRLELLSEEDLQRQLDLVDASLTIRYQATHQLGRFQSLGGDDPKFTETEFMAEAEAIYQELLQSGLREDAERSMGMVYLHHLRNEVIHLGPLNLSYYDGILGIACFAAALYRISHRQDEKDNSLRWISPLRESLRHPEYPLPVHRMPLGMGHGVAGILSAFTRMAEDLEEPSLREDALHLLGLVTPDMLRSEERVDWFNGVAGLLHASTLLFQRTGSVQASALAESCLAELIRRNFIKHLPQRSYVRHGDAMEEREWTTGMADLTGILLAMVRWKTIAPSWNPEAEVVFQEGLDLEQKRIQAVLDQDPADGTRVLPGLGAGIAGMGLLQARLAKEGQDNETTIQARHMVQALTQWFSAAGMTDQDSLWGGNAGLAEWWLAAGGLDKARATMGKILEEKRQLGSCRLLGQGRLTISNPSLFQGLSGLGYMLLRCVSPDRVPSLYDV